MLTLSLPINITQDTVAMLTLRRPFTGILRERLSGTRSPEHSLGYMYMKGEGVEQDNDKAIYWFKNSAAKGKKGSYLHLAKLIYEGEKVSDYWLAYKYLKILAEEDNNAEAQYYFGLSYVKGRGITADPYEGFKWIKKSAEQENTDAMYEIADHVQRWYWNFKGYGKSQ